MSSTGQKSASTSAPPADASKQQPQLVEEDDEFEEFPQEDWPKHETFEAKFAGGSLKSARVNGVDALWADNWDDDDIEDSWARQLRGELQKQETGPDVKSEDKMES